MKNLFYILKLSYSVSSKAPLDEVIKLFANIASTCEAISSQSTYIANGKVFFAAKSITIRPGFKSLEELVMEIILGLKLKPGINY